MGTPAIPHFGTTLYEVAPDPSITPAEQAEIPFEGQLLRTHRWLELLGMELYIRNMYGPNVGRQYIYRRGRLGDLDYFEKDSFTSYSARFAPPAPRPRIGDTIFRVVHYQCRDVYRQALREDLIRPIGPDGEEQRFLSGEAPAILIKGPDDQAYELCEVSNRLVDNHAIFIWIDPAKYADVVRGYAVEFDIVDRVGAKQDFHGIGEVTLLTRIENPVTIGILTPYAGETVLPRWTDDVFAQVGYSHFRLGSPRKAYVRAHHREMFPDTGDVSYVMFHDAYLELIDLETAAVPA
jgi:hypothetical protein